MLAGELGHLATSTGHELRTAIEDGVWCLGDDARILQIGRALATNAMTHTPRGHARDDPCAPAGRPCGARRSRTTVPGSRRRSGRPCSAASTASRGDGIRKRPRSRDRTRDRAPDGRRRPARLRGAADRLSRSTFRVSRCLPTRRERRPRFHVKTRRRSPSGSRRAPSRRPSTISGVSEPTSELTHVTTGGDVRMVDVGAKPAVATPRSRARPRDRWRPRRPRRSTALPKGDALVTAQLAGIMAAKRTAELFPLCHPLPLTHVDVRLAVVDGAVEIEASAETTAQTGVEMEALTAVVGRRADRLRHGEGDRQGDDDRGDSRSSRRRRSPREGRRADRVGRRQRRRSGGHERRRPRGAPARGGLRGRADASCPTMHDVIADAIRRARRRRCSRSSSRPAAPASRRAT